MSDEPTMMEGVMPSGAVRPSHHMAQPFRKTIAIPLKKPVAFDIQYHNPLM